MHGVDFQQGRQSNEHFPKSSLTRANSEFQVGSFIKWVLGIALSLTVTGQLKWATLRMIELAVEAQKHQLSFGKFSTMLTSSHSNSLKQKAKF
jgi:hypothetical protein